MPATMNATMGRASFATKLTIYDVFFVTLIFLISFVFSTNWLLTPTLESIPYANSVGLNGLITALAFGLVILFILFLTTGKGGHLSIFNPTIIIGVFTIPLWILFNGLLAVFAVSSSQLGSSTLGSGLGNALIPFLGVENFNAILQVVIFGTIESLVFAVLLGIFISANKGFSYFALIPLAILLAFAHTAIAVSLSPQLGFTAVLVHQAATFFILGLLQISLGTAANVSAHWYKNLIANASPILWVFTFVFTFAVFFLTVRRGDTQRITSMAGLNKI